MVQINALGNQSHSVNGPDDPPKTSADQKNKDLMELLEKAVSNELTEEDIENYKKKYPGALSKMDSIFDSKVKTHGGKAIQEKDNEQLESVINKIQNRRQDEYDNKKIAEVPKFGLE